MNQAQTAPLLKKAKDATLIILADVWPETYMYLEQLVNDRTYVHHAGAMMFYGQLNGALIQLWTDIRAIEGEQFLDQLEEFSQFDRNANAVLEQARNTHIEKRPRFRQIAFVPVANLFVKYANLKHDAELATPELSSLEQFHNLVLKEAQTRGLEIPRAKYNYPPPGAGSAPLESASKLSAFDLFPDLPRGGK